MAGIKQIEASQRPPLNRRLDELDAQEAEEQKQQSSITHTISESDLSRLEEMSREELLNLFKLIYNAGWGKKGLTGSALINVALNTPDEVAEAFKLKLAAGGLNEDDMFKALSIMREWFDRSLGKAAQSIKMTVEDKGLGKLSDARLLRLESELARMTGSEAIVIMPEPKKLEED